MIQPNPGWFDVLGWLQVGISIVTLGGVAFAAGRLYGRMSSVEKLMGELRDSLGADGGQGNYVTQKELELIRDQITKEHGEFDRRLEEFNRRLGRRR